MGSSNAARVQGAGPNCTDGDPVQVCPEPGSTWDVNVTGGIPNPLPVSVADCADVTQGCIADAAVTGDNPGTISAKLRGLLKQAAQALFSVVDTLANPAAPIPGSVSFNYAFNGATWDRVRTTSVGIVLLALAARTTTQNIAQSNLGFSGVYVFLRVTAVSGTGGLRVRIKIQEPASGTQIQINSDHAPITAPGTYVLCFYPTASVAMSPTVIQAVSLRLTRSWSIEVQALDASSYTYSLAVNYVTT